VKLTASAPGREVTWSARASAVYAEAKLACMAATTTDSNILNILEILEFNISQHRNHNL
jgi:hypothetical protein